MSLMYKPISSWISFNLSQSRIKSILILASLDWFRSHRILRLLRSLSLYFHVQMKFRVGSISPCLNFPCHVNPYNLDLILEASEVLSLYTTKLPERFQPLMLLWSNKPQLYNLSKIPKLFPLNSQFQHFFSSNHFQ